MRDGEERVSVEHIVAVHSSNDNVVCLCVCALATLSLGSSVDCKHRIDAPTSNISVSDGMESRALLASAPGHIYNYIVQVKLFDSPSSIVCLCVCVC